MKKIVKLHWNNYLNSDSGKEVVAAFDKLTTPDASMEELLQLACRFNPEFFRNISTNEKKRILNYLDFMNEEIKGIYSEIEKLNREGAYIDYKGLSCIFFCENDDMGFDDIPQNIFKSELSTNLPLSMVLSRYFPDYYIPNFFPMQFVYFKKILEKYDIDLPCPIALTIREDGSIMMKCVSCSMNLP